MRTWTSRVEALAVQNQARDDAMLLERRARVQVCTILDLVMQLATLPDLSATDGSDREAVGGDGIERPDPDTSTASMPTTGLAVRLLGPFELHAALAGDRVARSTGTWRCCSS